MTIKGARFGIRTLADLRDRCVIVAGCDCWHPPPKIKSEGRNGYRVWMADRQKTFTLDRAVYLLAHGKDLPRNLCYVRTCDTWGCANPEHRKLVTRASRNSRPRTPLMTARIMQTVRAKSRISDEVVAEIRRSTEPSSVVAARFGVSGYYVNAVRRGDLRAPIATGASVFGWRP